MKIGAVLMAAGNAERFGENKLAQTFGGKTLASRALDALGGYDFDAVAVVTQYPELEKEAKERGYIPVKNEHPDRGISHTISLGLDALPGCDGILFSVADQPCLSGRSVKSVVEAWKENPAGIAAAAHDGVRGNPCIFSKDFFPELRALKEDKGGNTVIRRHEEKLTLTEVPKEELTDCDTPEALEKLKNGLL